MAKGDSYELLPDKRGATWDLVMYVPMVVILVSLALQLWYGGTYKNFAYVLIFAASFIFFIGANRVLSSRLIVLPGAPRSLELGKKSVAVVLKGGERVELVKELRYFPDYAGKSFGLTGMDLAGRKRQFVFHKGQFGAETEFKDIRSHLAVYK
jgi:hypothetical protein